MPVASGGASGGDGVAAPAPALAFATLPELTAYVKTLLPTWKALLPDGGNFLDPVYRCSLTDEVRRVVHPASERLQALQAAALVGGPDELITVLLELPDVKMMKTVLDVEGYPNVEDIEGHPVLDADGHPMLDAEGRAVLQVSGPFLEMEKEWSKKVKVSRHQALTGLNQMQALAAGEDLGPIAEGEADLESFQSVDQVLNEIRNLKPTLEALLPAASIPELDDCMMAFSGFERLVGIKHSLVDGEFDSYGETLRYKITIPGIGLRVFDVSKDLLSGMMQ